MRRIAFPLVVCSLLLSACSTSGPFNTMPRLSDEELRNTGKAFLEVDVRATKERMNGWSTVLDKTYRNKEVWKVATDEIFFYGSVAFSLASAQLLKDSSAGWKKARNIGAGSAFGADLLSGHYKFETQELAFRNAMNRARCGAFAMANIMPEDARMILLTMDDVAKIDVKLREADPSHPGFITTYNRIPITANEFIEKNVLGKLYNDLKAANPTKPTLSELSAAMDKWNKDQKTAAKGQEGLPTPEEGVDPAKNPRAETLMKTEAKKMAGETTSNPSETKSTATPKELETLATPLAIAIARESLVSSVVTFESQLRACDISN